LSATSALTVITSFDPPLAPSEWPELALRAELMLTAGRVAKDPFDGLRLGLVSQGVLVPWALM
jgi:hypothetical protein